MQKSSNLKGYTVIPQEEFDQYNSIKSTDIARNLKEGTSQNGTEKVDEEEVVAHRAEEGLVQSGVRVNRSKVTLYLTDQ